MAQSFDYDAYAKNMRLTFSNKDMIKDDGSINHKYFLVKKAAFWSPREDEALIRGLDLFGVGKWSKIKFYELSTYSEIEIELRTNILLGAKDLTHLMGTKLNRDEVNAERKRNGLPQLPKLTS